MEHKSDSRKQQLVSRAKSIPKKDRVQIIHGMAETEIHAVLGQCLSRVYPDSTVEVTHGRDEYGRDLVIVHADPIRRHAIGLVVKKGKQGQQITGKTGGPVDEIISQASQALSIPGNLKTFYDDVPVTEVWVVLAGEITNNARRRLRFQLGQEVPTFAMDWVITQLTESYPEAFFGGRVTDAVESALEAMELGAAYRETGLPLSDCYVEPVLQRVQVSGYAEDDNVTLARFKIGRTNVASMLDKDSASFVFGMPGSGKSFLLQKIAIEALHAASTSTLGNRGEGQVTRVPILLRACDALTIKNPEDIPFAGYPAEVVANLAPSYILVDCLEELPPGDRATLLSQLKTVSEQIESQLVIATRTINFLPDALEGYGVYSLCPFTYQQSMKLLGKLVTDSGKLQTLKEGLAKHGNRLPLTPLALRLLVQLLDQHHEIPASITELFDQFTDLAVGKHDKDKGIASFFEWQAKKRFLSSFAFQGLMQNRQTSMSRDEFDAYVQQYASRYELRQDQIPDLIEELDRSCILDIDQMVSFSHRSYLDFYVGFHIYDHQSEISDVNALVEELYYEDVWGDAALFYVGLKKEIDVELLARLAEHASEAPSADIRLRNSLGRFMIGRLLQAAWHSEADVKAEGIRTALSEVPGLRQRLEDMSKDQRSIAWTDSLLLLLSRHAFGSVFLAQASKRVLDELAKVDKQSARELYQSALLLWGISGQLESDAVAELVEKLEKRTVAGDLEAVEKARLLLMLRLPASDRRSVEKAIDKRIRRMAKRAPGTFRAILPKPSRPRHRKKKR